MRKQQISHARQARLCATVLQRQKPLVSLYLFFLMGAEAVNVFSVFPFFISKKGTYPYLFKYNLNCRPTPNKTFVLQGETPVVNVLSATTIEEPTSQSSNPKTSQSISLQQMFMEDSGASTSTAPSTRSTSTKPSMPDINATRKMINDLFSVDEVVHSFYHCTETTCNYQKEKGKKTFDHAWIFRRDLTYDAATGLWWLLFIKEKGMYCLLCRLHQAKGKHNKSASYGMEPAVRFQTSALVEHCSGQKHQDSIAAEMLKRTLIFKKNLTSRTSTGMKFCIALSCPCTGRFSMALPFETSPLCWR